MYLLWSMVDAVGRGSSQASLCSLPDALGLQEAGRGSPMLGAVNLISPERMKANQPVLVLVLWISGKELK